MQLYYHHPITPKPRTADPAIHIYSELALCLEKNTKTLIQELKLPFQSLYIFPQLLVYKSTHRPQKKFREWRRSLLSVLFFTEDSSHASQKAWGIVARKRLSTLAGK